MSYFCSAHRFPEARIDSLDDPFLALTLIHDAIDGDRRPMTIALLLDTRRRGLAVMRVDDTVDDDHVFGVAEAITGRADQHPDFDAVVLASIRPGRGGGADDLDRWIELDDEFDTAGIRLIEWFVIGDVTSCPRAVVGEPPRW